VERLRNKLVELRQKRGLRQQEVADRAGVTRQSLSALEAGRSAPSTTLALRLAHALACRVEDLFWLEETGSSLVAEVAGVTGTPANVGTEAQAGGHNQSERATKGNRVLVVSVGGKWVAHPLAPDASHSMLTAADGVLAGPGGARGAAGDSVLAKVALLRDREELHDTLLCVGCAPALGVLTSRASARTPGRRVLWLERSSYAALEMLRRGYAHVAGAHLFDEDSGEFNVPFVRRLLPDRSVLVFNLVRWEAGLLVAPGNPRRLRGVEDLARPDIAVARRDAGAGAQKLLERTLGRAGIPAKAVKTRGPVAAGHMDVGRIVAMGVADAGVSIRSAALAYGLDFLPLAEERFDLIVSKELSDDPRVIRLLDTLSSRPFRRELESLGGYGVRESGHLIARKECA
jgi:molybdate-binding protein/DNA-binding XRE family transcriptional regulator